MMPVIINIIRKKRDGEDLTSEEIQSFISDIVLGKIQDVQIGAMLMAMYLNGMSENETSVLTRTIMQSGRVFEWPKEWRHLVVDKHSTGGVGDKISLVLAPALAACGLKVPMISGRGLDFTGGTLDKLESISGLRVDLQPEEIEDVVRNVGCCIVGQTKDIVPADKILYSFRDVTSTVPSISLTTSSIISKKAAEGIQSLILDVKYGSGAFMKNIEDARKLGEKMVKLGRELGIKTSAAISAMDVPIGYKIGNALEVVESIECLQGKEIHGLNELVTNLGGELLRLQDGITREEGTKLIARAIADGSAINKFREMIVAQGVDPIHARKLCDPEENVWEILTPAKLILPLQATKSGFIHNIDALKLGKFSHELGAGRTKAGEPINHAVGLELLVQLGSEITRGDVWIKIHCDKEPKPGYVEILEDALDVQSESCVFGPRITQIISSENSRP